MVPDWPPLTEMKREWVRLGPDRFAATYPDPVLYVCGLLRVSFAPVDAGRTREMIQLPDFEGFLKRSRLVADKVIPLKPSEGNRVSLGSHPRCDVMVPDLAVSHIHCAFEIIDGGVTLTDAFSKNGTWVNERRIPEGEMIQLLELDLIYMGRYAFRFFHSTTSLVRHNNPTEGLKLLSPGERPYADD